MKTLFCMVIVTLALHCGAKGIVNTNTIQYAARSGDLIKVKKYLAEIPKLLSSKEGIGTLTEAAVGGQSKMVLFLISQGADVNEMEFQNMTPLARIASYHSSTNDEKFIEVATILITNGATIDPVDDYKKTPLIYSVETHNSRLAEVLLEHGANQITKYVGANNGTKDTPLYYALKNGDMETVKALLKYNPPIELMSGDIRSEDMETPLLWAVKSKKIEAARMLLEHGASVTHTYTNETLRMIRQYGAYDDSGKSPLYCAVLNNDREMVSLLLEFKAPPNAANQLGKTPLHWAAAYSSKEIVRLLLDAKAPLDVVDHDGGTPLFYAEAGERKDVAEMLREAGPNVQGAAIAGLQPPTKEAMRNFARRIANGDATAFDELTRAAANLYSEMPENEARLKMNYYRMKAAFDILGEEAGKGNDNASQALLKSIRVPYLKSFAPDALGIAAGAGNKESLDMLIHYDKWYIDRTAANLALQAAAENNLEPVVVYYEALLNNSTNKNQQVIDDAKRALERAAAKGNTNAQASLDNFKALHPGQ